jgi:hypothetical protein
MTPRTEALAAERTPQFEIVGLHRSEEGRCCAQHPCCGRHLVKDDLVRLVSQVVQIGDNEPEEAIKVVRILDGTECCTVAFVPCAYARLPRIKNKVGKFAIVMELFDDNPNPFKKRLSDKNFGMASCLLIDDVPRME